MEEVLPGVYHWLTPHPRIGLLVSSYWLDAEGVLFDPLVPADVGLDWFAERATAPVAALLSNRHHLRQAGRFRERFGVGVYCNRLGLHEFEARDQVQGFDVGDVLPGGVVALEMDAICPDDTALHVPRQRAVVLADAVVRGGTEGPLGFVPDSLMDEPPDTRRRLLAACERLLGECDFEHLLLAHGGPVIGEGRTLLEDLLGSGGRTAFEL